jgi:cysteine desulfuration protein SufE
MNAQPESPREDSADAAQSAIVEEFSFFGDWTERYQYLIDLGRKLPPFPESLRTEENKVHGCQSQVWLVASGDRNRLHFQAASDSAIVSGLIALLLRVYSDRSAEEIAKSEPRFIQALGLARHLSPTRNNGLAAMLNAIHDFADATKKAT